MRTLLACSLVVGCTSSTTTTPPALDPLVPSDPLPVATGAYVGSYHVPADPALVAAATFQIDSVEWTVLGDALTLHYNLPRGLVGGTLGVTLGGTLAPGATTLSLASASGTGSCVATTTKITCQEIFGDLGTLPISMAVVEQIAAQQYGGPVVDRTRIASIFSSDPIGTVDIDLTTPAVGDTGGSGGSGGGGGGGGGSGNGHP